MVADFGFVRHSLSFDPVSSLTDPPTHAPGHYHPVRAARVLAARLAIDAGRYELDDTIVDGVVEAVLAEIE